VALVLAPAAFSDYVLGLHILGVIAGFGVIFAYPVFLLTGARLDPGAMPWFFRVMSIVSRRLINPGLAVVLVAGIYLAADEHQFSRFYVGWGIVAVVVLGAIEGAVMAPRLRRLAELSARDVAAVEAGGATREVRFGADFRKTFGQLKLAGSIQSLIVVVTVFVMTTRA
jgi:hypothetical protein